jgi:hypothetical protein
MIHNKAKNMPSSRSVGTIHAAIIPESKLINCDAGLVPSRKVPQITPRLNSCQACMFFGEKAEEFAYK